MSKSTLLFIVLFLTACAVSDKPEPTPLSDEALLQIPLRSEMIVPISDLVTGMAFTPAGDLIYAYQNGSVYLKEAVAGTVHHGEPHIFIHKLEVAEGTENGLLGLALAPDFAASQHLFLFFNVPDAEKKTISSRIDRFRLVGRELIEQKTIVVGLPATAEQRFHYGGGLQFGPDGKLYLIFGDRNMLPEARDPSTPPGSILRYNPDGSIPDDNPFPGSPVYAFGIRNGIGLAWDPVGRLYASENGASCDDELNLIQAGLDYGWGTYPYDSCPYPDDLGETPVLEWTPPISPVGLTFYTGDRMPEFKHDLMLCGFIESKLIHIVLDESGRRPLKQLDIFIENVHGPCRTLIIEGPDGWLYMANGQMIHRIGR